MTQYLLAVHHDGTGPYTAAKENLGGFWITSAADPDTALKWARQATAACRMAVEVRPFAE